MDPSHEEGPAQEAFKRAQEAFRKKVSNLRQYDATLRTTTAQDVYNAARKIQEDMAGQGRLKYFARIEPFLSRLAEYAAVIEVFVSAKADILALIWGPIKLVLLWTSRLRDAMDEIASAMESIGEALPHFQRLAETFPTSEEIKAALALFYEDILDFHATILEFLQSPKSLSKQFKQLWQRPQKKLEVIISSIKKHQYLLKEEVTFVDIQEAKEARTRELNHFRQVRADEISRKYASLKANINPPRFHDRLDRLQTTSVAGCDTWLLNDSQLLEWADHTVEKTALLWLSGIPGAGKTYLAASIVHNAKEKTANQGHILFAFLTYAEKARLNARAILLSLLFQVADADRDFQSILVQSPEREIQENAGQASTMLQSLLAAESKLTYIIIDGLDEIEEHERQVLLRRLKEMVQDCKNLRLMISCRREHDIAPLLAEKAVEVSVNERNFGSIQTYIDYRFEQWMSEGQFSTEIRAELKELIAPLSTKAAGMFLYAKVFIDSLEYMGSIDEVRDELKVYPKDMNEAYHRIFNRINQANSRHRDRGRRVLGWTGCAPVPLTTFEMEQALAVSQAVNKSSYKLPRQLVQTDFLKLCGPIVEIFKDQIQFVHFTAQEYVFDAEIPDYIQRRQATEDLASSLIAYLSMGVLDLDSGDDEIKENIMNGTYRLFEYAYFFWPTVLGQLGPSPHSASLEGALDRLAQEEETNQASQDEVAGSQFTYKNPTLEASRPGVYRAVCDTFLFRLSDKRWDWNRSNSDSWVNNDPLLTSQMLVRIQDCHAILADDPAYQRRLQLHYGKGLLRCTFPFCSRAYRGFETHDDMKEHSKIHGKPWKCTIPNCDFSSIGFSSGQRREEHFLKLHLSAQRQLTTNGFNADQMDQMDATEAQHLLFMLVFEGNAADVEQLLTAPGGKRLKAEVLASARMHAAKRGYSKIVQLLAPETELMMPKAIVVEAVKSGDAAFAKEAIAKSDILDCTWLMKSIIRTEAEDIYALWEEHIISLSQDRAIYSHYKTEFCDILFKPLLFNSVKNKPLEEARLMRALTLVSDRLSSELLGTLLIRVAKSSCSVKLAKVLLGLGAPVDYPSGSRNALTALHVAAKKLSPDAAFFMQFLIGEGAAAVEKQYSSFHDPKKIGEQRGAMAIVVHVGMTFEELRDKSWRERGCPSKHKRARLSHN